LPELLNIAHLEKSFALNGPFGLRKSRVKAVDDVSLTIGQGETVGLVGESGCGKTTVGRLLCRLIDADGGSILFDNKDILGISESEFSAMRKNIQMIFQDPQASLNPRMTVGAIVREPFVVHGKKDTGSVDAEVMELFLSVGLSPEHYNRYPRELSGGQQQRVGICRAIALRPRFLILDEPTSALDVCVQAQILNTLKDIQTEMDLTYLFISHDLSVINHMSDRIAVMYLGQIVEIAPTRELFDNTLHPYTRALFSAIPTFGDEPRRYEITLSGDVPNPAKLPPGCRFHPRCSERKQDCERNAPNLVEVSSGHWLRCNACR
jgi:oligopeptide/dipeptide ABC transporter ATP-binding protein